MRSFIRQFTLTLQKDEAIELCSALRVLQDHGAEFRFGGRIDRDGYMLRIRTDNAVIAAVCKAYQKEAE